MSDAVVFREEHIAGSGVPNDPVRCPRCKGGQLALEGFLSFPHEEVRDGDSLVSKETDWKIEQPFELRALTCLGCRVRFIIQDDENVDLSRQVSELLKQLEGLTIRPTTN